MPDFCSAGKNWRSFEPCFKHPTSGVRFLLLRRLLLFLPAYPSGRTGVLRRPWTLGVLLWMAVQSIIGLCVDPELVDLR